MISQFSLTINVERKDDRWFTATAIEIPDCIAQGETAPEAIQMLFMAASAKNHSAREKGRSEETIAKMKKEI